MNKIIKLIGMILFISIIQHKSYAQIPVTDVAANGAIGQTNMLQSQMMMMTQSMQTWEKNMENLKKSAAWIKDLQTAKKMYDLLQSTYCGLDRLAFLMKNTRGYNDCFFQFKYDIAMVKVTASAENLMVVMSSFSMERNARMDLMNQSIKLLEESQSEIAGLTAGLGGKYREQKAMEDAKVVFTMNPYKRR